MNDDFGTPEACAVLFDPVREINRLRDSDPEAAAGLAGRLRELGDVLGVLQLDADDFLRAGAEGKVDAAEVEALIQARLQARADKNWAESDRIRDQLTAMGVVPKTARAVPPGAWLTDRCVDWGCFCSFSRVNPRRPQGGPSRYLAGPANGQCSVSFAPPSSLLPTSSRNPCRSTIAATIDSPSPNPGWRWPSSLR